MATINYGSKELTCKIVYYGPGFGGKTTNLQQVHAHLPDRNKGRLTSLATQEDRTLFFDLLPVDMGMIGEFRVKVQLYTVPGQVRYNTTRKVVLRGVDGIVVVFDSDPRRENANATALSNLRENLAALDQDLDRIPTVFQYNKRDLYSAMDVESMNDALNPDKKFPEFESIAIENKGVGETIQKVCSMVFQRLESDMMDTGKPRPAQRRPPAPAARVQKTTPRRVQTGAQEPAPDRPAKPARRLRQLCDLRWRGLRIGHAVVAVEPGGPEEPGRNCSVMLDLHPALGRPRRRWAELQRENDSAAADLQREVFSSLGDGPPLRMIMIHRHGDPSHLYVETSVRGWRVLATPEGFHQPPA